MKDRIKELRKALQLTQSEFGERLGVGKTAISKIERGDNGTTEQTLRSICREFGASYVWLTTGAGSMFENGDDDAALHLMIDRVMASENDRVKSIFKGLGDFTEEDWRQVDRLLDKLLEGQQPWTDEKKG